MPQKTFCVIGLNEKSILGSDRARNEVVKIGKGRMLAKDNLNLNENPRLENVMLK